MEDTEHLGETQQLAPRSSIPGSASDWLDKLGALGENEQLKPGFEDSFGSPLAEIGTVVNYDIDRATGSLGKPEETVVPVPASLEPVPPPIEPAATPPVVENIPPAQVPEATAPRPEQVPGQSAAPAAGLDLAFLDSMLAETPVAEAPFEHEAGVLPSQPTPINENVPSEVPSAPPSEPSLSWLQELQNLPEPQSAQTLEPSIEAAASPPAEILEFIPTPPPVVAEGMPKLDLSGEAARCTSFASRGAAQPIYFRRARRPPAEPVCTFNSRRNQGAAHTISTSRTISAAPTAISGIKEHARLFIHRAHRLPGQRCAGRNGHGGNSTPRAYTRLYTCKSPACTTTNRACTGSCASNHNPIAGDPSRPTTDGSGRIP